MRLSEVVFSEFFNVVRILALRYVILDSSVFFALARLHGFKRTRTEVSRIVYIGHETVGRRVCDFTRTPAAQLSLQDFDKESVLDSLPSCNPPAFERGRLKWEKPDGEFGNLWLMYLCCSMLHKFATSFQTCFYTGLGIKPALNQLQTWFKAVLST
jgi:hypothetical protein